MGYIIKSPTGGGGGDATAANQQKQIDQLAEASGYPSVLKDNADLSVFYNPTQRSVFKIDATGESVFKDPNSGSNVFIGDINNLSVFKNSLGKTITEIFDAYLSQYVKQVIPAASTVVTSFTSTTLAGVATLLETFLQTNPGITIVNISFSSGGAAQHDVLLTYNV